MSIFFNDSEEFIILDLLYYIHKDSNGKENLLLYNKKDEASEKIRDNLKTLKAKFKVPNFFDHNNIIKSCVTAEGIHVNWPLYKETILKTLLKQIETDDSKQEINETNFGNLHPVLGIMLFEVFNTKYLNPDVNLDEILDNAES